MRAIVKGRRLLPPLLTFIFSILIFCSNVAAQSKTVSGDVRSGTDNQPLPGVTVQVKGTSNSQATDAKGHYSIGNVSPGDSLVFSYVNYTMQTIAVEGRSEVNVTLQAGASALDQVVVVGYGTQKKVNVTGAVSTISSKDLSVVPVANVSTLLAGRLPGLVAVQRSGEPGADNASLSIRGFGNALVVVDGIVNRDFTRMDPNSIESITILKDAASAAVYGVSGGNGVILVTTKRGSTGKPAFSYSFNYGAQHVTRYPRFVNSAEYATLKNEASVNSGGGLIYSKEEIEKYRAGTDPNYPNFDYYDYFVRDYTPQVQQNLIVRGGGKDIKYFLSLGGLNQASMWKGGNQDFSNYNFRSNIDARINDNLDISVDFGVNNQVRNNLTQDSYLMASWLQYSWPIYAPKTPDGKIASTNYGLTAYLDKDLAGYIQGNRNTFQGNLSINYKIPFITGLSAKATFARDLIYDNGKNWLKQYQTYNWDEAAKKSVPAGSRGANSLQLLNAKTQTTFIQTSLNYSKSFSNLHNVKALLLYEESEVQSTDFNATRINYVVPIDQIFAGPTAGQTNGGSASDDGRQSLVGRLNYDFSGKYLFEYSFRYDGSPRFPAETRWGYFSGISGGWRLSEESFIKDHFRNINNLKLRASWGKLGNDNTGKFQYLTGFVYPSQSYILGGNTVTSGLTSSGAANPFITWESSQTYNIGVDLDMWGRLFGVQADVFYRKRSGLLAQRNLQLPTTYGDILPAENLNSDKAKGFELVLNHSYHIRKIRYDISANVSYTKLQNDHVEQKDFTSDYDLWRNGLNGRNQNIYWGLNAIGQFQSQKEINSSPIQDAKQNSTLRPGDIKYEDYNMDGVIDNNDTKIIGKGLTPEINYGLSVNVNWNKFNMSMNWQGAANFNIEQQSFLIVPFNNGMNSYAYFMDRWHHEDPSDPSSPWVPGKYPSTINAGAANNNRFSSFWFQNATYVRLKSLSIAYNIENALTRRFGLHGLNVSLSGQNLLTITGLDYIDPEAPSGRLSYYPQQKTYNLGLNVTF